MDDKGERKYLDGREIELCRQQVAQTVLYKFSIQLKLNTVNLFYCMLFYVRDLMDCHRLPMPCDWPATHIHPFFWLASPACMYDIEGFGAPIACANKPPADLPKRSPMPAVCHTGIACRKYQL